MPVTWAWTPSTGLRTILEVRDRLSGRARDRVQGRAEGRLQGRAEGRVRGRVEDQVQGHIQEQVPRGRAQKRVQERRMEGRKLRRCD